MLTTMIAHRFGEFALVKDLRAFCRNMREAVSEVRQDDAAARRA